MALSLPYQYREEPSHRASFMVGNTYRYIPPRNAKFDRNRRYKKIHDWTLYVDIVKGTPDCIERVLFDLGSTFEPQTFISRCPISIKLPNGQPAWRFSTRQQSYGIIGTSATITIRGAGGTKKEIAHTIILDRTGSRKKSPLQIFDELRGLHPLHLVKMPDTQRFGIELEISSAPGLSPQKVADFFPSALPVFVTGNYSDGREASNQSWKLVPDGSIVCSRTMPYCNKFEMVSPILQGGKGLSELASILRAIGKVNSRLKVNKSMGFHVHIDVSNLSAEQLVKVCQNFIKYEDVIDSFMPYSRRSGSEECDRYFSSNRDSIGQDTNKQRHCALEGCYDVASLAQMMNYNGRYYKLNLQNLVTGRQPTIEFRQHSATLNYDKISSWVRFCTAFVTNSARLPSPKSFKEGRDLDFQFIALFQYVIKDRALRNFYKERRYLMSDRNAERDYLMSGSDLMHGSTLAGCCSSCKHGGSCEDS